MVDSSSSSSGSESRETRRARPPSTALAPPGCPLVEGTSQRCMGSMRAGPADSESEAPRKPRRASIRSLRENSPISATVSGPAQGRSTPDTDGDRWTARSPRSSIPTTQPKRSENNSERICGIGSRGCSPSSQRRTLEVSVLMWWAPNCRALRLTWRASSPSTSRCARTTTAIAHWGASQHRRRCRPPGTPPSHESSRTATRMPSVTVSCPRDATYQPSRQGTASCQGHVPIRTPPAVSSPSSEHHIQGLCTESNPTITPLARRFPKTPPFATPSNEPGCRFARFT